MVLEDKVMVYKVGLGDLFCVLCLCGLLVALEFVYVFFITPFIFSIDGFKGSDV